MLRQLQDKKIAVMNLTERIKQDEGAPNRLRRLWREQQPEIKAAPAAEELHARLAGCLLQLGEVHLAIDICRAGHTAIAEQAADQALKLPLERTAILGLARMGAQAEALARARLLANAHPDDPATLCLLGRIHKDAWAHARESSQGKANLQCARDYYLAAYHLTEGDRPYAGINAATTSLFLGEPETSRTLAEEVLSLCRSQKENEWTVATRAEALLLSGPERMSDALEAYAKACELFGKHFANLATTRRQAEAILRAMGGNPAILDDVFRFPKLIAFAGHMIDRREPARITPRFPPQMEDQVRALIAEFLDTENIGFGVCSAACGSDILFIEDMQKRGKEIHIVMPWGREEFLESSVRGAQGADWEPRFGQALERADSITHLSQHTLPEGDLSFEWCSQCIVGLARRRARLLGAECSALAICDGKPGGPGGTSSFVTFWRKQGLPIKSFPMPALPPSDTRVSETDEAGTDFHGVSVGSSEQDIKTILFADVAGFSRIGEKQLAHFAKYFLGHISALIAKVNAPDVRGNSPILTNTWGDALYFVFDTVLDGGLFALKLRDLVTTTRWEDYGLPVGMGVRIALHTGPVFICVDPVIRQITFTGSHVSHAARIEPKVERNEVYSSEAFAALAAAEGLEDFACDYLGEIELPKNYGRYPMYRVRPGPPY